MNLMVSEQSPVIPTHIIKTTIGKLAPFSVGSSRLGSKRYKLICGCFYLQIDRLEVASRREFLGQITSFS